MNQQQIPPQSQKFSSSISYYLQNSYIEFKRRQGQYCLAFLACTIVVLITAVAQTVIDNAPIIFLQLAEGSAGEVDIQIQPSNDLTIPDQYPQTLYLNQTRVSEIIKNQYTDIATPRFTSQVRVSAPYTQNRCADMYSDNYIQEKDKLYQTIFNTTCRASQLQLIAIDSNKENTLKVGRNYKRDELNENEVLIHKKRAGYYGIQPGDIIILEIFLGGLAELIAENYNQDKQKQDQILFTDVNTLRIRIPYKVKDTYENLGGKVADKDAEQMLIVENKYFIKYASQFVSQEFESKKPEMSNFIGFMKRTPLQEYSTDIVLNLPDPRINYYLNSNYDQIQASVTNIASNICEMLGTFAFKMTLPVLQSLYPLRFGALFLGITLNIIILILFVLSILLIYSLLMVSVDTKTFEMGVIRVLGLNTTGIVQLIIIQALTFVIPGIIIGLALSIPCLAFISNIFESQVGIPISSLPSTSGFVWAIILGLLIPLLSALYPIKEALNQTLYEQLDTIHSKTSAIHVQIELDSNQIPWTKIWFGLISIAFGVSVYYLLPLALLSFNLSLLLGIFFWILIGLLFGLVLLSLNVQHLVERLVTFVCLFWQDKVLKQLVVKNLVAHRIRNRKTAIMYALSLGFVIFITVSYNMELQSASYQARQRQGVYMSVTAPGEQYFQFQQIEKLLNEDLKDLISEYSWITDDLQSYMNKKGVRSVYMTNIGQLYNFYPQIVGVSPNFWSVTFPEYLDITQQRKDTGLDTIEQLYSVEGSQTVILGEYYRSRLDLQLDKNDSFLIKLYSEVNTRTFELRASSVLNAAPALRFSQIPSVSVQNIIVSLPTYLRLSGSNQYDQGVYSLPLKRLLLKLKDYNDASATAVYSAFQRFSEVNDVDMVIWDYRDFSSSLEKSGNAVSIIFIVVNIIVMFLCFFSLISSMSANILEQTKEIAVLRAVGLTQNRMIALYIDEAFVLVFSSSLLGILIGTFVGWTMTIQRVLFTQLPIKFVFPTSNLIVVLIVSLVCAFGSAFFPARNIMKNQISQIVRISN